MFQSIFVKIEKLAGGFWKEFQQMHVCNLLPQSPKKNVRHTVLVLH